jgi:hypothetical protein
MKKKPTKTEIKKLKEKKELVSRGRAKAFGNGVSKKFKKPKENT